MNDLLTVMWKESKGLMRQGNSRKRAAASQLLVIGMMALIFPLQLGRDWPTHSLSLIVAYVVPLITVGITIPEAFAGERERHTLETLLASRLPDRAILFGKLGLGVLYGWLMTLATLLASLVVVNVAFWNGTFAFFSSEMAVAHLVLSLLISVFMAGVGVLVSLRAETAQGAQQAATMLMIIPIVILQVVPILFMTVVPNGLRTMTQLLSGLNVVQVLAVAGAVILLVDVLLILLAIARFQRARLSVG